MAQPDYLNDSSSTDTDEDWEQDAQMFAHLVQQANASSSIRRSKAPNIDRGRVEGNARLTRRTRRTRRRCSGDILGCREIYSHE
ncbi:hypothetical protein OSB04_030111 [Centaurea solstitialis]|uniref:Uncharacterized protein n=1 Tax=Centaurea solstitialis TaxID=347529 RepID=A0AA38SEH6_9ASTR|nr:hypothetical protein OSB04_030111 [Centaurea solstitialis]